MKVNFKKFSFWSITLFLLLFILVVMSLILLAAKTNPLHFLSVIFIEPWTSLVAFSSFVHIFIILLLVSLAVAITFKYKIYNFGVSGQMMISAIVTYVVAVAIFRAGGTNRFIVIFLLFLSIIVGFATGLIVAILKNYFHINEIVSTILLNFIAWEGYKGLITSTRYKNQVFPTILSLRFSLTSGPFSASNLFSAGIIVAFIVLIFTILLFNNRTLGFKLNAISKNPSAAKQARIEPNRQILKVLPISSAIASLAGYLYFLATSSSLLKIENIPQEGFYGIAIAALAFYEPSVIVLSNFVFTLFIRPINFNSFAYLKNPFLSMVMLGFTIYFLGFLPFLWYLWDQSPVIQEKWFKIKSKLFHIATPITTELPELVPKKPEIEALNLNLQEDSAKKSRRWRWKRKHSKRKR